MSQANDNIWYKINPCHWHPDWGFLAPVSIMVSLVLGFVIVAVLSITSSDEANRQFKARCDKIPNSLTIIDDQDKCYAPVNGKIVLKFKES